MEIEISIEELFIRALGNSRIESEIVGDLTRYSKVDSRNKKQDYVKAGEKYCDNSFSIRTFEAEINRIIGEIKNSGTEKDFKYPTNFTLVLGIYEEGMGDNNFPKIRKDVLKSLEKVFSSVGTSISFSPKSFIEKKNGVPDGSGISESGKGKGAFYKEKLDYFTRTGKPDLKDRVKSFKNGIGLVLKQMPKIGNKNFFLVSHSKFMQALYNSICDTNQVPYFDNLDVLHLIVKNDGNVRKDGNDGNSNGILVKGIYRWVDSYNLEIQSFFGKCTKNSTTNSTANSTANSTGAEGEYLNLFMMRHCVACHNVVSKSKILEKKVFRSSNFGSTSMCLRLVEDLNKETKGSRKIMGLIKMLKENTGTDTDKLIESINFGSSVSLRTTLTGLVVQRLIAVNIFTATPPEKKPLPPLPDLTRSPKRASEYVPEPVYAEPKNNPTIIPNLGNAVYAESTGGGEGPYGKINN